MWRGYWMSPTLGRKVLGHFTNRKTAPLPGKGKPHRQEMRVNLYPGPAEYRPEHSAPLWAAPVGKWSGEK